MGDQLSFQYCPKLAVFSADHDSVLLCRRKGETDYDNTYSFVGGKMEHQDSSIIDAIRREKNEEIGRDFQLALLPYYSIDIFFMKADGGRMILPHYYARHTAGGIELNNEYSRYQWIACASLAAFEPKISNITWITPLLARAGRVAAASELVVI
jgi:ADP-ribose pyrophosphatase YjhB (NUDIX family)